MLLNQINGYHHDLVYNTLSSAAQSSKDMGTKLGPTLVFYTISERFFDSHNWAFLCYPSVFLLGIMQIGYAKNISDLPSFSQSKLPKTGVLVSRFEDTPNSIPASLQKKRTLHISIAFVDW